MTNFKGTEKKFKSMNWKDFLKPNWEKIAIFFIISTIYVSLSYWTLLHYCGGAFANLGVCVSLISSSVATNEPIANETLTKFKEDVEMMRAVLKAFRRSFTPILVILSPGIGELTTQLIIDETFKIPILLLYWYILSCTLVWVHSKIRKK
jgi:hypothetical protein